MRLVDVDLHTRDQSIAMVDAETGDAAKIRATAGITDTPYG
jgi:hypothetical protein